jgi:putative transposase
LLSSYTRAINKQEDRIGSLFRCKTKAKNGIIEGFITVEGRKRNLFFLPENNYAATCFNYIHENPVKSGLVNSIFTWKYSSAAEYKNLNNQGICNHVLAKKLGLF